MLITILLISSCNNLSDYEKPPFVTTTPDLGINSTETATLPVVETATATAEVTVESKEIAELNQRIRDFLNSEGKYTEEAFAKLPHKGFDRTKLLEGNYFGLLKIFEVQNGENGVLNPNGWADSSYVQFSYQGIFLGGEKRENEVVFYMGMKDNANNNIVVPIGTPVFPERGDDPINMLKGGNFDSNYFDINSGGFGLIPQNLSDFDRWLRNIDTVAVFQCSVNTGFVRDFYVDWYKNSPDVMSVIDHSDLMCGTLYNNVPDLRGRSEILENDTDIFWKDKDSFRSVVDIEKYIFYDMILFVRP